MKNTSTSSMKWLTSSSKPLWILLAIAFVIRLILLGASGYTTDVQTFEAWTLTLRDWGFGGFYAHAGFADYPPGYLYILGVLAGIYKLLAPFDYHDIILQYLVKLPAILADIIDAVLVFTLVSRFAPRYALGSAAFLVLNPAILAISAFWGQVDSVAAVGTLLAVWLIDGVQRGLFARRGATIAAWTILAASILIKPAPIVLVPLFLVLPLTGKTTSERLAKAVDALLGIVAAIAVTYLLSIPFSPDHNFIGCMQWLLQRFEFASNVYPYNSVNAFNLYAIASDFWMPDSTSSFMTFGLPQVVWGAGLVVICVTALTVRFAWLKTPRAMLEAVMLASLAFFAFATRMHERYIFNALIFAIPLIAISRAYLIAASALTVTLGLNLIYSLVYLTAVTVPQPNTNTRDLMPLISHPAGFIVVLVLFAIGFQYMGYFNVDEALEEKTTSAPLVPEASQTKFLGWTLPSRTLAPCEGLAPFVARDWILAVSFSILSFLLCIYRYWEPAEKYFDEIYYARSGAEYLKHIEQYEWTHPPFTKLVITVSMMLFGGIPHGDTSYGWRFLNVVVGAIMVGVLYRFVKKISGSTLAAAIAAGLMVFDGFHFVQSRIATPEITVACLSLATLAAFYEYWVVAQVRSTAYPDPKQMTRLILGYGAAGIAALIVGIILAQFATHPTETGSMVIIAKILLCFYPFVGFCLAVRWWMLRTNRLRTVMSYPDGSLIIDDVWAPPLGDVPAGMTITTSGTSLTIRAEDDIEGSALRCDADGTMTAINPAAGWTTVVTPKAAPRGLLITAVLAGLLGASKWNGLFDLLLIWAIMIAITFSRSMNSVLSALGVIKRVEPDHTIVAARPDRSAWGNPFGFPLELTLGVTAFVGMTIYVLSYVPYFVSFGHDLTDLVQLQHSMYAYHADLRATHPYQSTWWQWPLLERPISYYYEDFRIGAARNLANGCCVSEILALPNPINWWAGLVSVPTLAWLAWRERRKGYALIVLAYFAQWLPWILSPRIAFEYHFFPNLALICASNAILLQRMWKGKPSDEADKHRARRIIVIAFLTAVFAGFIFWYPIVSATHTTYSQWQAEVLAIPDQLRALADHLGLRWI